MSEEVDGVVMWSRVFYVFYGVIEATSLLLLIFHVLSGTTDGGAGRCYGDFYFISLFTPALSLSISLLVLVSFGTYFLQ